MALADPWLNNPDFTPYPDRPTFEPGDEVTIPVGGGVLGETRTVIVPGVIAPLAFDLAPYINERLRKFRRFASGVSGTAICDYTPVKTGTMRKLGAF